MIFKLLPILLTSKLPLLWYHVCIYNELAPVSLKMLGFFSCRPSLFFFFLPSTHTNLSRFYKSLPFPSSKKMFLELSVDMHFFPPPSSYLGHTSITTPLPCTGPPCLLIYTLVCMSGFVPTDCKLQACRNLVFLVFVHWYILISTCWKKEEKEGKRKG